MKKIKLKKNPSKKKFKFFSVKFLFLIVIVYISYSLTLKYSIKNNMDMTNEKYVNYLLNESYRTDKPNYTFIVNESLKLLTKLDLSNPDTILDSKITTITSSLDNKNNNNVKKDAKAAEDDYDISTYEKLTSYINNPNIDEVTNPEVYIYNTHQLETYSNGGIENLNVTPNIMMTSYLLSEKLTKLGVPSIVEDTNMAEFIRVSNLENSEVYATSRIFINNAKTKNPSLKYFIDIHRDSVDKNISTCEINGKKYARILFVIGTSNETYSENEKIVRKIDDISDDLYPCMSRGIYKRETKGWSVAYNQDISPNVMLIEVGAKENTIDEVLNTVDALSKVLKKYMKG